MSVVAKVTVDVTDPREVEVLVVCPPSASDEQVAAIACTLIQTAEELVNSAEFRRQRGGAISRRLRAMLDQPGRVSVQDITPADGN